jgi:hypothetical protein
VALAQPDPLEHYETSAMEGSMSKLAIAREFWHFLRVRKKWWLAPIVVTLVLLGALIVLTEGSAVAPFIYALF